MKDLKERTIRGGFAKLCAQAANLLLRLGSLIVLARLLEPRDFGLVGMVAAATGVLNLFRDFGLSTATIQRTTVTDKQMSTLFWINMLAGLGLGLLLLATAPLLAVFYREPHLASVTAVTSLGFIFNAAGVQHSALLQRQMRFVALSVIEFISLVGSIAVGIGMAVAGYGYWALVGMTITSPAVFTAGVWLNTAWVPGMPHTHIGFRSLIRFGGTITLNGLVVYVTNNLEKVLLGRYWGADAIAIYGRAYQLVNIPTDGLNSAADGVAFAALSRVKDDPSRLKSYFLKGYSLLLGLTLPISIACALFSDEIIVIILGPKWKDAAPIFRFLAPMLLVRAMINPFTWLLWSIGLIGRSLKIALAIAPLVIAGVVIGLPYGPRGVALGYSAAMTLWVVPHIVWCVRGTMISFREIVQVLIRPLLSGIVAGMLAFVFKFLFGHALAPIPGLVLGGTVFAGAYLGMLLYVMGQKALYVNVLRGLRHRSSGEEEILASA